MIALLYMKTAVRSLEVAIAFEILIKSQFSQSLCCSSHKILTKYSPEVAIAVRVTVLTKSQSQLRSAFSCDRGRG